MAKHGGYGDCVGCEGLTAERDALKVELEHASCSCRMMAGRQDELYAQVERLRAELNNARTLALVGQQMVDATDDAMRLQAELSHEMAVTSQVTDRAEEAETQLRELREGVVAAAARMQAEADKNYSEPDSESRAVGDGISWSIGTFAAVLAKVLP